MNAQYNETQEDLHTIMAGIYHSAKFKKPIIKSPHSTLTHKKIQGQLVDKNISYSIRGPFSIKSAILCVTIPKLRIKKEYQDNIQIKLKSGLVYNILIKAYFKHGKNEKIPAFTNESIKAYDQFFNKNDYKLKNTSWNNIISKEKIQVVYPWFFMHHERTAFPLYQTNVLELICRFNLALEKNIKMIKYNNKKNKWMSIRTDLKYIEIDKKNNEFLKVPYLDCELIKHTNSYIENIQKNYGYMCVNYLELNHTLEKEVIKIRHEELLTITVGMIIITSKDTVINKMSMYIGKEKHFKKISGRLFSSDINRKIKPTLCNYYMILFSEPFDTNNNYPCYSGFDLNLNECILQLYLNEGDDPNMKIILLNAKKYLY